jgi:hypothetical protein
MAIHTELSPSEAADRLAIRELFDAYAHCADTRDAEGQQALFTPSTRRPRTSTARARSPSMAIAPPASATRSRITSTPSTACA